MELLTVKLNNGITVLAKLYHGKPSAVTYANRAQAYAKKTQLIAAGIKCDVTATHPFYIRVITEQVYTMTHDLIGDGAHFFYEFTFHAEDDKQAQDKAAGWARYHSFDLRDVKARLATLEEAANTNWIHDEWTD